MFSWLRDRSNSPERDFRTIRETAEELLTPLSSPEKVYQIKPQVMPNRPTFRDKRN